jgi:MICOS complex subunit MIC19
VNRLEDNLSTPETTPERQNTLDNHVRARIQAELARLQAEEVHVREQIEAVLERENLDREKALSGTGPGESHGVREDATSGNVSSSALLQGDLEEVQKKVERFHVRRQLDDHPQVKEARDAVLQCYQCVFPPLF